MKDETELYIEVMGRRVFEVKMMKRMKKTEETDVYVCPRCGSGDVEILDSDTSFQGDEEYEYAEMRCRKCGFMFTKEWRT